MTETTSIHGHEIVELISRRPDGIRLSRLVEVVSDRFGQNVSFHSCTAVGMDLDGLLHFLEAHGKVRVQTGVVYPGAAPACAD